MFRSACASCYNIVALLSAVRIARYSDNLFRKADNYISINYLTLIVNQNYVGSNVLFYKINGGSNSPAVLNNPKLSDYIILFTIKSIFIASYASTAPSQVTSATIFCSSDNTVEAFAAETAIA